MRIQCRSQPDRPSASGPNHRVSFEVYPITPAPCRRNGDRFPGATPTFQPCPPKRRRGERRRGPASVATSIAVGDGLCRRSHGLPAHPARSTVQTPECRSALPSATPRRDGTGRRDRPRFDPTRGPASRRPSAVPHRIARDRRAKGRRRGGRRTCRGADPAPDGRSSFGRHQKPMSASPTTFSSGGTSASGARPAGR